MAVIIGIDPHKATHAAVAIDGDERLLARLRLAAAGPDRPVVGVGGAAGAGADVDDRVRRRARQAAHPTAARRR